MCCVAPFEVPAGDCTVSEAVGVSIEFLGLGTARFSEGETEGSLVDLSTGSFKREECALLPGILEFSSSMIV